MNYTLVLSELAQEHLKIWRKSGQTKTLKKIAGLFAELEEHPRTGTGHVEELKNCLSGYWSRQIDKKNRLIYSIDDNIVTVEIISLRFHYSDK